MGRPSDPRHAFRTDGLGRILYEKFFQVCRENGRGVVRCVTSPVNKGSIGFHRKMGFEIEPGEAEVDGFSVSRGFDPHGGERVLFVKRLTA